MTRRAWFWVVGIAVVVVGLPAGVAWKRAVAASAQFEEQLQLARREGLPTNSAEFAALITPAKPEENAAPLYRSLKGKLRGVSLTDLTTLDRDLTFRPTQHSIAQAQQVIADHQDVLEILGRAANLPRCWFDRPWAEGAAVLMPEFADMKAAAKVELLKGSLAAQRGNVAEALNACMIAEAVGRHAGEEPTAIAHLVRESIYALTARNLGYWAFVHPDKPEYIRTLVETVGRTPKPNLRQEGADELYCLLTLVDQMSTARGRAQLGIREEDVGALDRIAPLIRDRSKARIEIVKAERKRWAALDRTGTARDTELDAARAELDDAMVAFPLAYSVWSNLGGEDDFLKNRLQLWKAHKLTQMALARALTVRPIPTSIRTSDLRSPFDDTPLSYRFDGHQITIEVNRPGEAAVRLKVPPDFKKP